MTDSTETSGDTATTPAAKPKNRRKFFLRLLLIVVVLALVGWGLWYLLEGRWYESTDDAYVKGNVVQITPKVRGTVISVGAKNGDRVAKGDVLTRLDPSDTTVALEGARAKLAKSVREVRGLYNNVEAAQSAVDARQTALNKAKSDYRRRKGLADSGAISSEMLAHARDALADARSALDSARQKYENAKAMVSGTDVASNPAVQAAASKLRKAFLDSVNSTMVAPVDGYVAKRSVQVGEHVAPGKPLMAVVPLDNLWVDANFKETQLGHMRIGQPVELTSDLYGGSVTYHGTVESLGIGTGSAFSLLPAENATGNWIKIVQRLPVRVSLRPDELQDNPLRVGLSMTATVNLHDRDGNVLVQEHEQKPAFTTDVYDKQMKAANALVKQVIHANLGTGDHGDATGNT